MDLHNKKCLPSMKHTKQCLLVKPKEEEATDVHDMEEPRISSNILTEDAERPDNIDEYQEEVHKEIKNYWHLIPTTKTRSDLLDHIYNYQWSAADGNLKIMLEGIYQSEKKCFQIDGAIECLLKNQETDVSFNEEGRAHYSYIVNLDQLKAQRKESQLDFEAKNIDAY
uniref:Uncharacterized protein n=1 Tax=Romanomermis culicivorax TaxID=13658 RepID=A0A915KR48_ROMCU